LYPIESRICGIFLLRITQAKVKFTLEKSERLRSQKVIDALFTKNCAATLAFGFRFSWVFLSEPSAHNCAVLFISSKRKLKLAKDRNRRKRLLRELYRLNKHPLLQFLASNNLSIALSINYVGAKELDFNLQQVAFQKAIQKIILELQKTHTSPLHPAH
jgi:ribonuclease P protein component